MFLSFFAVTAIFFDGFYKSSNFYLPSLFTKKRLYIYLYRINDRIEAFGIGIQIGFFFSFPSFSLCFNRRDKERKLVKLHNERKYN